MPIKAMATIILRISRGSSGRLFHLAATAATVGPRRVVEVWHTTRISVIRRCIGAVEPPIVSRIAVIGNAARRMTMKNDVLKLPGGRRLYAVAGGEACRTWGLRVKDRKSVVEGKRWG